MEKKLDYKKPTAQVVYFDDEDIVAGSQDCDGLGVKIHHDDCSGNECAVRGWKGLCLPIFTL